MTVLNHLTAMDYLYFLMGIFLLGFSALSFLDKKHTCRWGTGSFWLFFGLSMAFGAWLPDWFVGLLALGMTIIAAGGFMGKGSYSDRPAAEKEWGLKIFLPAFFIPLFAFVVSRTTGLHILAALAVASVVGLLWALFMTKDRLGQSFQEGRRLIDAFSWAAILPQFLAALGAVYTKAGVGATVTDLIGHMLFNDTLFLAVVAYGVGMVLFTMLMGNAFAAFGVITVGIGVPLLLEVHHGNPVVVGIYGLLAGYCGTLMTPIAANFNIVPSVLLEMKDRYGVVKQQVPIALCILAAIIGLMYVLGF